MRVSKPGVATTPPADSLTFDGQQIPARMGESVAASLTAAGHYACRDSHHTGPRGVFCGMGVCSECSVVIDGQPDRLACMEPVTDGMRVERNAARRTLGMVSPAPVEIELDCDVLVVGAGPAGLRAALAAHAAGANVVVLDERSGPGGQFFKQPASAFSIVEEELDRQFRAGRELRREVAGTDIQIRQGMRVWGSEGPHRVYAANDRERLSVRSRALVLATGAYERGLPFPGWTLPGVMTTGAAQTLLRSYLVAAGPRVLIAGNGPLNLQLASELSAAGARVVAVAESADLWRPSSAFHGASMLAAAPAYFLEGIGYLRRLARRRIPILARTVVREVRGGDRAQVAVTARIDERGQAVAGTERTFEIDAVCLGYGFIPSSELARTLGCATRVDNRSGALVVQRDSSGRTSIRGVWVVGDGGSIGGANVAEAMGTLCGLDVARHLGLAVDDALARTTSRTLARSQRFQRALWRQYNAPALRDQLATADTVICRCEEVTLGELVNTDEWLDAAGTLKRVTRAGMGKCQGRYCAPIVNEIAARRSRSTLDERSGFAPQWPLHPTPVATMALGPSEPGE